MSRRPLGQALLLLFGLTALAVLFVSAGSAAPAAQPASGTVSVEWFGWSHYRFTSPTGKVILTNPFTSNPDSPIKPEDIEKARVLQRAIDEAGKAGTDNKFDKLVNDLNLVLGEDTAVPFDNHYWGNIYHEGLEPLIQKPRDIVRAYSTRWRTRFHADGGQCVEADRKLSKNLG